MTTTRRFPSFAFYFILPFLVLVSSYGQSEECGPEAIIALDTSRVLANASKFIDAPIRTVTADRAERSAGGPNDFFSEGDYWWPVPGKPDAPYEQRDGQSNPDNFVAHRVSMIRFSDIVGALTSAYLVTGEQKFADAAAAHLHAWFISPETKMNPHLRFGQAIKGRHTGRSIGVIDTLHLVDVALSAWHLGERGGLKTSDYASIKQWFADYSEWMNTHPYGVREREHPNNHSIAWSLQIAAFAKLTGNTELKKVAQYKFQFWYLPDMMRGDGAFPRELARTKPYGYSLFVIDLMAGIAQIASDEKLNLWTYKAFNQHNMARAIEFIGPYIDDKQTWPYRKDIEYWDEWPIRQPSMLFAGYQLRNCALFDAVSDKPGESSVYEVRRNVPIRYPILWVKGVN